MMGITSSFGSNWQLKHGTRFSMMMAAVFFGGGHLVAALGVHYHNLYALYLGLGVLSGIGMGLNYSQPIKVLISWFPDRRGFAGGMAIAGFGLGATFFAPLVQTI